MVVVIAVGVVSIADRWNKFKKVTATYVGGGLWPILVVAVLVVIIDPLTVIPAECKGLAASKCRCDTLTGRLQLT